MIDPVDVERALNKIVIVKARSVASMSCRRVVFTSSPAAWAWLRAASPLRRSVPGHGKRCESPNRCPKTKSLAPIVAGARPYENVGSSSALTCSGRSDAACHVRCIAVKLGLRCSTAWRSATRLSSVCPLKSAACPSRGRVVCAEDRGVSIDAGRRGLRAYGSSALRQPALSALTKSTNTKRAAWKVLLDIWYLPGCAHGFKRAHRF